MAIARPHHLRLPVSVVPPRPFDWVLMRYRDNEAKLQHFALQAKALSRTRCVARFAEIANRPADHQPGGDPAHR